MITKDEFIAIYQKNYKGIRKLCFSYTSDILLAEDLAQETFTTAWHHRAQFRNDAKITTWIYRIAVNICLTDIRKKSRYSAVSIDSMPDIQIEPANYMDAEIGFLYECIGSLKETDRLIITLVLENTDYAEIAEIMDISEGNLRIRIHRIKKELTEKFRKNDRF